MFIHKVKYYETDKMGITHHSNYIRWMEEARVDFLEKIGFGYDKLEQEGIASPVIAIDCEYKESSTFNDDIEIDVFLDDYTGVRLTIRYEMRKVNTKNIVFKGKSKHCFIDVSGKPIKINRVNPKFDKVIMEMLDQNTSK